MRHSLLHRGLCLAVALSLLPGCSFSRFMQSQSDESAGGAPGVAGSSDQADEPAPPADETYEGRYKLARFSEQRGLTDRAVSMYQALLVENPADARLHHRLGVLAAQGGRFDEADAHLSKARTLAGASPPLLCDMGYLYYLQQRYGEAETVLRQALAAEPTNKAVCNNLALVLGETGRFEECLKMFQRNGSDAQAHANLAFIYAQIGAEEAAIATYSHALTLDPSLTSAADALVQLADRRRVRQGLSPLAQPVVMGRPGPPSVATAAWPSTNNQVVPTSGPAQSDPAKAVALAANFGTPNQMVQAASMAPVMPSLPGGTPQQGPPSSALPHAAGTQPTAQQVYQNNPAYRAAQVGWPTSPGTQ